MPTEDDISLPLIFKFIDYSKDMRGNYNYLHIQTIYFTYDITENKWIELDTYIDNNKTSKMIKYQNVDLSIFKIDSLSSKFLGKIKMPRMFNNSDKKQVQKKTYIIEKLINNIDITPEIYFNKLYNSFDYIHYDEKYIYFDYSGDPSNPYPTKSTKSKIILSKSINVIGCIDIKSTKTEISLKNLSRSFYLLGIFEAKEDEVISYCKRNLKSSKYTSLGVPTKNKNVLNIYHCIYCILDQVEEFNHRIMLEIILNKNNLKETDYQDMFLIWDKTILNNDELCHTI